MCEQKVYSVVLLILIPVSSLCNSPNHEGYVFVLYYGWLRYVTHFNTPSNSLEMRSGRIIIISTSVLHDVIVQVPRPYYYPVPVPVCPLGFVYCAGTEQCIAALYIEVSVGRSSRWVLQLSPMVLETRTVLTLNSWHGKGVTAAAAGGDAALALGGR